MTVNDIIETSPAQMIGSAKNYEMAGMALPPEDQTNNHRHLNKKRDIPKQTIPDSDIVDNFKQTFVVFSGFLTHSLKSTQNVFITPNMFILKTRLIPN